MQECGLKRLKVALACSDDAAFIRDYLLPFLKLLGSDALSRGTCKQPLIELLQTIFQVRTAGSVTLMVMLRAQTSNDWRHVPSQSHRQPWMQ
jgi:hypothetical protein